MLQFNAGLPCYLANAGFHCHTIIKTIQQIKSRIKEIKEDEYSDSLTKVQVCAMFRAGNIRRNVLLKFLRLCMETPCLCPSQEHKYGRRKLTKTYVIEFCYKKPVVVFWGLINIYVSTYSHTRTVQIAKFQGHPTSNFGKYLFERQFEI